ncbi:MAG: urate hydroxylase PuuD, partial [Pseudomonadota bacterium]
MEALLLDWANLLLRWAHLIAGISWIGTSFYFVALDRSLHKNKDDPPTLFGSAWEVHGGGFYHVQKYTSAPDHIPTELIWYRWEAYLTWVTGMGLMVVLYYANAGLYLIDPAKADLRPAQAIMISLASLGGGWLVYQELCRSRLGRHSSLLGLLV